MSFVVGSVSEELADRSGSGFTSLGGKGFYRIADVDRMDPFFVNVVSHCDVWMYVSSRGGLSAGRVDADGAFFPYETVDRLHDNHPHTGGCSQFWVQLPEARRYWEPFVDWRPSDAPVRRNLYKNLVGNQLVFEEFDETTQLTYRMRWAAADGLGIVKTTQVINSSDLPVTISVLDGFRNVLPWGIPRGTYQFASCLTDAYKRSECDASSGLGIFAVTAGISDGTHPMEVLRSNVAWTVGLPEHDVCLANRSVEQFRRQNTMCGQHLSAGKRGNYFVSSADVRIEPGASLRWHLIGDVGYDHGQLVDLRNSLLDQRWDDAGVEDAIQAGTTDLIRNIASADGLQHSADEIATVHHFANVLFNNLRGGVFANNHLVEKRHFVNFVAQRNITVASSQQGLLQSLPEKCSVGELAEFVRQSASTRQSAGTRQSASTDLKRLVHEYLPIQFSRRHGDPSRPWNTFAIRLKDANGDPQMKFEGNWRDIFQNWEGLCLSFPEFLPSVTAKFLNGSTIDGFNPYRVTSEGMEWEEPDPEDPWSNIGYWGDHQIIYLLKLLEGLQARKPDALRDQLGHDDFVYLDVPYRLKPYQDLVRNGRDTIEFDRERSRSVAERVQRLGEDGKLLCDNDGEIVYVNLAEKLLVPMLSKLSNLVVDGGIWMNTQRPEWNDANNALVGVGVSVVTLCYLRRYLEFCERLFRSADKSGGQEFEISRQVTGWFEHIHQTLTEYAQHITTEDPASDTVRREILDKVGKAFCDYRSQVYAAGIDRNAGTKLRSKTMAEFCQLAKEFADHSIRCNRRADDLYHAYNLIEFSEGVASIRHLYEMLEGQVAVLSSGALSPSEAADLLDVLFESRIYREDQQSFMLYPERQLADFLDRNVIPQACFEKNELLQQLYASGDRSVVSRDAMGVYRFQADFRHRNDLRDRLDALATNQAQDDAARKTLIDSHRDTTLALFDTVFQHTSYTGRSGTMYGYEGLGCIYWHMVSKLLLAVQENYLRAVELEEDKAAGRLAILYYRVRDGLGPAKSPEQFGAFPTDPYSHTPGHAGARQPGMTGQVKEEILTRFGEFGVSVSEGKLAFNPTLLREMEFISKDSIFRFVDVNGNDDSISTPANSLAFTYCQIPIIYRQIESTEGASAEIEVVWANDDSPRMVPALKLDAEMTRMVLARDGKVAHIIVWVSKGRLQTIGSTT